MADTTLSVLNTTPPQNMPDDLCGVVVNVTNGQLGNANTSYFYFQLVAAGYNIWSIQFVIQNTTLTVEGSNSPLSTADGAAAWTDITTLVTIGSPGGSVASINATGSLTVAFPLPWSRIRLKRVTTNATNAFALTLTRGRVR